VKSSLATIEAFTYPDEFAVCDGTRPVGNGLFMTHQPRKSIWAFLSNQRSETMLMVLSWLQDSSCLQRFGRTECNVNEHSLSESVEPFNFSWQITTKPPRFAGLQANCTPSDR
jgi:hypothetical protein